MKRIYKFSLILAVLFVLGFTLHFPFHKWARKHVNYVTASDDHPLDCISCHLYLQKDNFLAKLVNKKYYSPLNLAVSADGSRLYVAAQDGGALIVVDPVRGKVLDKIIVGNHPHSVVVDNDKRVCYVTNQWSDNVSVINLETSKVTDTLQTGTGPAGLALTPDNRFLYVVNSFSNNFSVFDLDSRQEIRRLSAGNNPTGIHFSPDGKTAYITSRRAQLAPYGTPVMTELTKVDAVSQSVAEHKNIESAYMMENVAFTPSGDLALVSLIRPKNLVPSIQVEKGWMMTHGFGIVEQKPGGRTVQLLLDEPNAYYPDPFGIVITPDGKKAFISSSGVDCISVISIDSVRAIIEKTPPDVIASYANNLGVSSRFVIKRIKTGANPKGIAISPDGKYLYVAEQLEDKIAVINTDNLEITKSIDLGGPRKISVARHGRRLLNNADHTFQNEYSCYTCHPDTHEDGLVYNMASKDMGRNVTNTQSLRDIGETAPFKWNGLNQTVYKQDGMRFSTVLTRTEPFSSKELDAIASYIMTGVPNPPNLEYNPNGELTEAQKRGKAIFERTHDFKGNEIPVVNRCITCHPAPFYTNRKSADVGTLAATDDSILFDTPHLNNIIFSPPYLHDGRALTLEEIWTVYGQTEQHGALNDLTKTQLNDLIEYLRSLRDPAYNRESGRVYNASFSKNSSK
jgi:YVTN family beta-propeller protein